MKIFDTIKQAMLWTIACMPHARVVEFMRLSTLPARSLIRAWHHLHVEKLITHDFTQLLAPNAEVCVYHAAIRHDDIRAIAVEQNSELMGVAYAPGNEECACALVAQLALSLTPKNSLPTRWKYETVFAREEAVPSMYEQKRQNTSLSA